MKPAPFDYAAPENLSAALELLSQHGSDAKLLAGGQSLVPLLNFRLASPAILIDVNRIDELDFVRPSDDGGLRIGALTRQSRIEREPIVVERAPLLAEAIPFIAHPQIRNRGTIGGTLAHADPAAELPAVAVALEARLRLVSNRGERWIDAAEFFIGLLSTALEPDEILTEVLLPPSAAKGGNAFVEVARRHGDYALAGVAAHVELDRNRHVEKARLVFLSAGDGPVLAHRSIEPLIGRPVDEGEFAAVAEAVAAEELQPSGDIHATAEFKRHLCAVVTQRALRTATRRMV